MGNRIELVGLAMLLREPSLLVFKYRNLNAFRPKFVNIYVEYVPIHVLFWARFRLRVETPNQNPSKKAS